MSRIVKISADEFEILLAFAAQSHLSRHEPIPELVNDNLQKVESCLNQPFQSFGGTPLYRGFVKKAAVMFYLLIKNHPLRNGNKRMAILTLAYFYQKNNRTLRLSSDELYSLAKSTAESMNMDDTIKSIEIVLKNHGK